MSLSEDDVRHIAKLAAIAISDEEIPVIQGQLNDIFASIEKLQEVSTRGVTPTSHVHGVTNISREDVIQDSLSIEALQKNAPDFRNGSFVVPKIIG
jgi:aspartyl-tRNA(Asn)/glutamyl-tRNA(Gln) amidotransferase subunit C